MMKLSEKFTKWYEATNGAISIMGPVKDAYVQGALEERHQRLVLANRLASCSTIEEVREILRIECDSLDNKED
jgi:hypothetical protein